MSRLGLPSQLAPFRSFVFPRSCNLTSTSLLHTSSSRAAAPIQKRKKISHGAPVDKRLPLIEKYLFAPRNPRVLRLGRLRYMRHWTISTAWRVFARKKRQERELELQRQYHAMREACEQLRILGDDGVEGGENVGRRYRESMNKRGVWDGVPVEYARCLVDWPTKDGWNHAWKRVT